MLCSSWPASSSARWGYRFGIPTLLLFLFTGMLFGTDGLGLEFNSHEDAQLIGMLSLSVILFSGGMDTKRRDIEPVVAQGLTLSTVGVLITTAVTGLLIYYFSMWTDLDIGLSLPLSMLLAATMSSTDSASVFNLLRSRRTGLKHNLRPMLRAKVFLSWVGLRGAVPIIFATYPVIAGIEDAGFLFNVVFVITLLSLALQGTTITMAARWLGLATEEEKETGDFGIELPDELESKLTELTLTKEQLAGGSRLQDLQFPTGTLVMMVKREGSFIVPNGQMEMRAGDILLTIRRQSEQDDLP